MDLSFRVCHESKSSSQLGGIKLIWSISNASNADEQALHRSHSSRIPRQHLQSTQWLQVLSLAHAWRHTRRLSDSAALQT